MSEHDDERGTFAVPGDESHESDESLTEEERGEAPEPPDYTEPKQPQPRE
jgi:hypothetical protein